MNTSKSTGPDSLYNYILKCAGVGIANSLLDIFNCWKYLRKIPDDWKISKVLPVFKKECLFNSSLSLAVAV